LTVIVIPASVSIVSGFNECGSLAQLLFEAPSAVREIRGFHNCFVLRELEIPAMVDIVCGFHNCIKLGRLTFAVNGRVRVVQGFNSCTSLLRVDIPESMEELSAFRGSAIRGLTLARGTRMQVWKLGWTSLTFFSHMANLI
jgi:hypothetical protein